MYTQIEVRRISQPADWAGQILGKVPKFNLTTIVMTLIPR